MMIDNPTNLDGKLRQCALQIATQLPSNAAQALVVLEYAKELVRWAQENPDKLLTLVG